MKTPDLKKAPLILLFGRPALFVIVQAVFAVGYSIAGSPDAWDAAAAWWPYTVTVTNFICLAAMIYLFRAEGKSYWQIFKIHREHVLKDVLVLLGLMLIIGPVSYFPNIILQGLLFEDPQITLDLLIRPLPYWAAYLGMILFAVTQGLVELPLYFAYVMPRLDGRRFPNLRPVILPALVLGIQHAAVPLLFDPRFITWRALMFVPFAFAAGILLHWRPRLLPYMAVIHFLMDLSFAAMLLSVAY
jgi:hypothetical protein